MKPFETLVDPLRRAVAGRVTDLFLEAGQAPVARSPDSLFGPGSATWEVHGAVLPMLVGGTAGLLLQMLRPDVLAGVWDHSVFRGDMAGRLRRTARFLAITSFASRTDALAAIARVNAVHARLGGVLPDGTPYRVSDPEALAWVHATEVVSFLAAWRRLGDPSMSRDRQDRYVAEMAEIGRALGADPVPTTHRSAWTLIETLRRSAQADARTRDVVRRLFGERDAQVPGPVARLVRQAAIDQLPGWARTLHRLPSAPAARPAVQTGAQGLSRLLGWALPG